MHTSYIVAAAIFITSGFALWKGDQGVRKAGLFNLADQIIGSSLNIFLGSETGEVIRLSLDGVWAVGLLLLAVRYASVWLGVALMLQAVQFSLHSYYLLNELPRDSLHAWINNIDNYGICLCLVAGSVAALRRRKALAREEAEREARRQEARDRALTKKPLA